MNRLYVVLCLAIASPPAAIGAATVGDPGDPQLELHYAAALADFGLHDFARVVLSRLHTDGGPEADLLRFRIHLARDEFDAAEQLMKRQAADRVATWHMKQLLADRFYQLGMFEDVDTVYRDLRRSCPEGPPPGLKQDYIDSFYRYAQMLALLRRREASIEIYEHLLDIVSKDDRDRRHIRRQLLGELTDALLEKATTAPPFEQSACVTRIREIAEKELFWHRDLWFGKAVVAVAQCHLLEDRADEALQLLDRYQPMLEDIDRQLREACDAELVRLSPLAGCYYIRGRILYEQAMALRAKSGSDEKIIELLAGRKE